MDIVIKTPELFFYELLEESRLKNGVQTSEETQTYILHFLKNLITNHSLVCIDEPLSLVYLRANESQNNGTFKLVGDSCLFFLGFQPEARPSYRDLYYSIGLSSYQSLIDSAAIYGSLYSDFNEAIDLLTGVNLILNTRIEHQLDLWWKTQNPMVKKQLQENNIIPMR